MVNGRLKGYEIKSNGDTLRRLQQQFAVYSQVFDTVTLVVEERHLSASINIVPQWWGIEVADCQENGVARIISLRPEGENPEVVPTELVQFLCRNEVIRLLSEFASCGDFARKPRRLLWQTLANAVPLPELKVLVRQTLKARVTSG